MKKFLLPLFAAVAISFSAAAQTTPPQDGPRPPRSPQEMAEHQAQRLSKDLGLSADQSAKVEQMQANRAKYDDQFKQVLSADQFAKYTTMQANRRQRGPGGPNMPDGKLKAKDGKVKFKAKPTDS